MSSTRLNYTLKRDERGIAEFRVPERPEIHIYSESGMVAVRCGEDCILIDPHDFIPIFELVRVVAEDIASLGGVAT